MFTMILILVYSHQLHRENFRAVEDFPENKRIVFYYTILFKIKNGIEYDNSVFKTEFFTCTESRLRDDLEEFEF